ncbi:hypothetical protein TKK_0011774 [Trichogramma kaykai]
MVHSDITNIEEEAQKCMVVLEVSQFPLYYLNGIDIEFEHNISELDETKINLICENLKTIICRHQNCIKFSEMFHSMIKPSALGIIVCATFVLILTGTWVSIQR